MRCYCTTTTDPNTEHLGGRMASKDGKIFDTIVYIGLGVNGLTAAYLLLVYFGVI